MHLKVTKVEKTTAYTWTMVQLFDPISKIISLTRKKNPLAVKEWIFTQVSQQGPAQIVSLIDKQAIANCPGLCPKIPSGRYPKFKTIVLQEQCICILMKLIYNVPLTYISFHPKETSCLSNFTYISTLIHPLWSLETNPLIKIKNKQDGFDLNQIHLNHCWNQSRKFYFLV